ncbi:huntingtin-interacting protein 1-related protein-like [Petromyzon marinus]|uniref:huntingtin-interacting protein 1-related protein-like n=1 Tax=Petromyzon marinus TaxID=7757 RepID=UPI003F6E6BAC
MERVASTIRHAPNSLLNRRSVNTMEADRETFERVQLTSINKAVNTQEVPVKEKHARICIMGTHQERGALTFWTTASTLPLSSSPVISWKFCHVLHKVLRDGHPNVLQDSLRRMSNLKDLGRMWGQMHSRFGQMVSVYIKLLLTKMEFHEKNPIFPPNLAVSDAKLEEAGGNDASTIFQLTVSMFDYMECELTLFQTVFNSLDMSKAVSMTQSGQCRLAPLIQAIQDCSHLYDYIVKLLFRLHSCLPADTLDGHRQRFQDQFKRLKDFFHRCSNLQYFKRLIQIPRLPDNPPDFLRASALFEHVKPVVVIPGDSVEPDDLVEPEVVEPVHSPSVAAEPKVENILDFSNGSSAPDERDQLIERLQREIERLKGELEFLKAESRRLIVQLRERVVQLERELAEERGLRVRAQTEGQRVQAELCEAQHDREETELAQSALTEVEKKAQASEQRFVKMKEKHTDLVKTHAELLRKNADVARQLTTLLQAKEEAETARAGIEKIIQQTEQETDTKLQEQRRVVERLEKELESSRQDLTSLRFTLESTEKSGTELSSRLQSLQDEKRRIHEELEQRSQEVTALGSQLSERERALDDNKQQKQAEVQQLQQRLSDKEAQEKSLRQRLLEEQFLLLRGAVEEGERIVRDAIDKLDDPLHVGCKSSPDYLITRAQASLESVARTKAGHAQYVKDESDASGLLRAVSGLSHLVSDTIVQGSATSHLVPGDQADRLTEACQQCGDGALAFLDKLKERSTLPGANPEALRATLERLVRIGEDLRPKGMDVRQEELGDLVEQEMASTSAAVEAAAARIEDMLNKSRAADTGIKLEVNERILASCTDLMQAIKILIVASSELQREIVESGRGAASPKEFYAKNSRWTEGLISASKAVGWGATMLVEAADKVVQGDGKFEELVVCSHEIAASTAQLVAASKVKAERNSGKLARLQHASRGVNEATARVVASTKTGMSQIEESGAMNFKDMTMTLTQAKLREMNCQVKVLELENLLEKERMRLGELRKKHYELAGTLAQGGDGN